MTLRAYLTSLRDGTAQRADDTVNANVATQGLLEQSGVAVESVSTEDVDLVAEGRIQRGERFSPKMAAELKSLGESTYTSVPVYDASLTQGGPNRGYYEISQVDVSPAHPATNAVSTYTFGLTKNGTQNTHWRAVTTNMEAIDTGLATGSGGLIGVPSAGDDLKIRWFDPAHGVEGATRTSISNAEYGDVDLFDPTDASFDDPMLLFELDYSDEGATDVRVYDTRFRDKYYSFSDGTNTVDINQWIHAYHAGYEFDGYPLIDNGLLRLEFDGLAPSASEWDTGTASWTSVALNNGPNLIDVDFTRIGPVRVSALLTFDDPNTAGETTTAVLDVQRGIDGVILRDPDDGNVISEVENLFAPIASNQTTDAQPTQRLRARSEV